MEIPDDFSSYVTAPPSPGRCSPGNDIFFYSVPTSPRRRTHQHHSTPPMTPYYHAYSELDESEFEFETSRSFSVDAYDHVTSQKVKDSFLRMQDQQRNGNHRNMASPLKLPPRLDQKGNVNQSPRTTPSSPRSPSFVLNLPFASRRLWNDDFDPFMVAMENVKEEEKGSSKAKTSHHNTGSSNDQQDKQNAGLPEPKKQVGLSPKRLALPKGLEFARQVRLIQIRPNNDKCNEVNKAKPMPTTTVETPRSKIAQEISGGPPFTKETKGQKIKRLLMSASFGKAGDENIKSRDQNSAKVRKPTFLRRLSFKSERSSAHCKAGEKRVPEYQRATMTQVNYRPRLLLCMGYGASYAK